MSELERSIDPTKPRRHRPDPPVRVPDARQSLTDDAAYSIKRATEAEGLAVASEIIAAVRWLRKWDDQDVRVRPYVREWYVVNGKEVEARDLPADAKTTDHYWRTHFYVHPPMERGLRVADEDARGRSQAAAQERKAELGLRPPVKPEPKRTGRSVRERG
jgi:hypothetical protein